MRTVDHYSLSKEIIKTQSKFFTKLTGLAFCFGNISPDINWFSHFTYDKGIRTTGHNYNTAIKRAQHILNTIHNSKFTVCKYYKVGKLLHYLTDCFTYVHNEEFDGTLIEHRKYEVQMHDKINNMIANNDVKLDLYKFTNQVFYHISQLHEEYIQKIRNIENDCEYILEVFSYIMTFSFAT